MLIPLKLSDFPVPAMPVKKKLKGMKKAHESSGSVLKRPAAGPAAKAKAKAKAQSLNEKVASWKKGLQEEKTHEGSDDSGDEAQRDKDKGQKFAKCKDQLPPHILDLYDNETKNASRHRNFRTMIINKLFTKQPNGSYQTNAKDPCIQVLLHSCQVLLQACVKGTKKHKPLLKQLYITDQDCTHSCTHWTEQNNDCLQQVLLSLWLKV